MRNYRPFGSATASRVVLLAAVSMIAVGCSSDITRFDDPFSNPFNSKTSSRGEERSYASSVPTTRVDSAPLGNDDIVTNTASRSRSVVSRGAPFSKPEPAFSTTALPAPPSVSRPSVPATPSVNRMAEAAAPVAAGKGGWSPIGGTTIQANGVDSLETLSKRYGVPASAIAQANGMSPGQKVAAGQSLVIPTYSMALGTPTAVKPAQTVAAAPAPVLAQQKTPKIATTSSIPTPPAPPPSVEASERGWTPGPQAAAAPKAVEPVKTSAATNGRHVVKSGESLGGIAARYKVKRSELAKANKLKPDEGVQIGQSLVIPGQAQVAQTAAPTAKLVKTEVVTPAKTVVTKVETVKVETAKIDAAKDKAKAAVVKTVATKTVDPVVTGSLPAQKMAAPVEEVKAKVEEPVKEAKEAAGPRDPQFRWPVRGHVVSRFGQSNGGAPSEGIKLSVPEGTAVRAAEDGKVAYAGSDLKHLGNLVLVRHANGFVSVYAHNSEINVRPGDEVRRGQTIAKAGQSGNATQPQLYFELRKGKSPVDPMGYLGKE